VSRVYRVQLTYRLAAGAFLLKILAAELLPNVTEQKNIFLTGK
jgi:hypothetical protein